MEWYLYGNLILVYLVLVAVGMILFGVALWALIWAVRAGQMDDLDTPAHRVFDDGTVANEGDAHVS